MRGLSFLKKVVFTINFIVALLLLASCLAPFIKVEWFPLLTMLSLGTPILMGLTLLFLVLCIILRMRKSFFLSLAALVLAYLTFGTFYKISSGNNDVEEGDLKVMSYNIRNFLRLGKYDNEALYRNIENIVAESEPDIICFQEAGNPRKILKDYKAYPYKYLEYRGMNDKVKIGIFSKYPIVNSGLITFPESFNNAAFADVFYKNDTIRIYSLHLESLGMKKNTYSQNSSDGQYDKLAKSFIKQDDQARIIREHFNEAPYRKIVCGDFNNAQYSRVYRLIKGNMNDTFSEKGSGFGQTYRFKRLPFRIDFIMVDPEFEVRTHKNFKERYSDHYPIMASFGLAGD